MNNKQIVYKTPESFCAHNAKFFLADIEEVFKMDNSKTSHVFFKVMQTKKIDLLGLLLVYKFLNYTVKKECFSNPTTDLKNNKMISNELKNVPVENGYPTTMISDVSDVEERINSTGEASITSFASVPKRCNELGLPIKSLVVLLKVSSTSNDTGVVAL